MDPVKGRAFCLKNNIDYTMLEDFLNHQRMAMSKPTKALRSENKGRSRLNAMIL
jgi:hypothetical protein